MATLGILVLSLTGTAHVAGAAVPPVGLGSATSYAVVAGSTITNTGTSVLNGDRGLSPGSDVTGFPPGLLVGASHTADAEALQAQSDLAIAYVDAAGRTPATSVPAELGGKTFGPGTYVGATLQLTGSITIDAGGDPDAVFLFKTNETLVTASNSSVVLIGEADPCNIYWQVSSSATLGTDTDFVGTVMASASITANTGADVTGRLLARTGAVTLDTNVITRPDCDTLPAGSPTTTTTTTVTSTTLTPDTTTTAGPTTTSTTIPTPTSTPSTTSAPPTAVTPTTTPGPTTAVPVTAPTANVPFGPGATTTQPDDTYTGAGRGTTTTSATGTTTPMITTGTLARSGSDVGGMVAVGLLALSGGVSILAFRRRTLTR